MLRFMSVLCQRQKKSVFLFCRGRRNCLYKISCISRAISPTATSLILNTIVYTNMAIVGAACLYECLADFPDNLCILSTRFRYREKKGKHYPKWIHHGITNPKFQKPHFQNDPSEMNLTLALRTPNLRNPVSRMTRWN